MIVVIVKKYTDTKASFSLKLKEIPVISKDFGNFKFGGVREISHFRFHISTSVPKTQYHKQKYFTEVPKMG